MTDQPIQPTPPPKPSAEIEQLRQQAAEHLDGWKRAKADYQNLKKEYEKDRQDLTQYVQAATLMEFVPVYDNLKRAIRHVPADQRQLDWVQGLQHTQKQFEDLFKTMGLEPIETIGKTFDPNLHHAVSKVKQPNMPAGQIIEELKSGFRRGERILQPADVVVAE